MKMIILSDGQYVNPNLVALVKQKKQAKNVKIKKVEIWSASAILTEVPGEAKTVAEHIEREATMLR